MDRDTRMFPCRVIVDEPEKTRVKSLNGMRAVSPPTLLSGMYVTVRIPIESPLPLLQVPAESIRPGEQLWIVRDGKLSVITISLVRVDGDMALVRQQTASLKAGDQVIISPLASINDGMPVTILVPEKQVLDTQSPETKNVDAENADTPTAETKAASARKVKP